MFRWTTRLEVTCDTLWQRTFCSCSKTLLEAKFKNSLGRGYFNPAKIPRLWDNTITSCFYNKDWEQKARVESLT